MEQPTLDAENKIHFHGFTLDVERGVLRREAGGTTLRPKTLELLLLLLRQQGRLVTRAEILDAVWPDVNVTDDSITQCIGEIRRAMGPEGALLLKTVPRRGYLLEAAAAPAPAPRPQPAPAPPPPSPVRRPRWLLAALAPAAVVAAWLSWPVETPSPAVPARVTAAAPDPDATAPDPVAESQRLLAEGRAVLRRTGRIAELRPEARAVFEQAVARDPTNFRAMAEIVFTYTNAVHAGDSLNPQGDLRLAQSWAERAMAIESRHAITHTANAALLRLLRRPEDALRHYRMAVELDSSAHPSRANIGFMLLLTGRGEEAAGPVLAAIAARPEPLFLGTWNTYLGLIELHTGSGDHGVARLREGLGYSAFMPAPERMLYLVAALQAQGDAEAAQALAADLALRQPEIGRAWLSGRALSDHPVYRDQFARILSALAEAGVKE
jgi:DNA-binding winged helix-turn-helix (wHTH) protein/Flp pilus assembly protein TadD